MKKVILVLETATNFSWRTINGKLVHLITFESYCDIGVRLNNHFLVTERVAFINLKHIL